MPSMVKCFCLCRDGSKLSPEFNHQTGSNDPRQRRTKKAGIKASSTRRIQEMYKEKQHNLRVFSFSELREATHDFNRLLRIGHGGFGSVHKGSIKPKDGQGDSVLVAIKKLNRHGLQGHKQWLAEVQFLGVVDHPNLVKLLGYCSVNTETNIQRLLVYEYMPNKSLEDQMFNRAMPTIPWKTRLNIMLGAAEGIAYLHSGLEVQVIYRDFKASNILLDKDFKPKLSDFGFAREGPTGDRSYVSTAPVGTQGYVAPEYVETGHVSIRSDVYSFGVVLYEILTGRRSVERNRPAVEQKLLNWVRRFPADGNMFRTVIDPRLKNQYTLSAAQRIAKLADGCLQKNARDRPTMAEVVDCLKQAIQESEDGSCGSRMDAGLTTASS